MQARLDEVEEDKKRVLTITSDEERGVYVNNLTERAVQTPEDIFEILQHSIAKRVTAETMCNGQSSRSHSIFTLNVHVKERDGEWNIFCVLFFIHLLLFLLLLLLLFLFLFLIFVIVVSFVRSFIPVCSFQHAH